MKKYHIHHITPKHMGGTNDPHNLKKLTVEEHAEAHKQLWHDFGYQQDFIAWKALSGQITTEEARCMAVKHALTGKKQSEEHVQKRMHALAKHRAIYGHSTLNKKLGPASDERKRKISEKSKGNTNVRGQKRSDDTKTKMSVSAANRELFECSKCGQKMQKPNLVRYHGLSGEKCKSRILVI
jgi:DNA-directed RNA polymerase subunit RPC12/RpoP